MSQTAENFNKTVTLDVGGTIYRTTRDTLSASKYLVNLVDGKWAEGEGDEEEAIFIDRDGFLFRYVLLYLRTGEVDINKDHLKSLQNEAQFYLLFGLASRIDRIINNDDNSKRKTPKKIYQLLDREEMQSLRAVQSPNYKVIITINCNKNIFNCPRSIPVHDRPGICGTRCMRARSENYEEYTRTEKTFYLVSYYEKERD